MNALANRSTFRRDTAFLSGYARSTNGMTEALVHSGA